MSTELKIVDSPVVTMDNSSEDAGEQQQQQQQQQQQEDDDDDRKLPAQETPPPTKYQYDENSSRPFNPDEVGPEIPNPVGDDLVLVNVPPEMGATRGQVERRKRLFAAKRFFASPDVVLPRRQKKVARKSIGQRRSSLEEGTIASGTKWDDFFQDNGSTTNQSTAASSKGKSENRKGKPKAAKAKSTIDNNNINTGLKPIEIYRGPPDDAGIEWPSGWIKSVMERQSGAFKGSHDRYWITPGGKKLRSMTECKKFLEALKQCGGNETDAKKIFKSIVL